MIREECRDKKLIEMGFYEMFSLLKAEMLLAAEEVFKYSKSDEYFNYRK